MMTARKRQVAGVSVAVLLSGLTAAAPAAAQGTAADYARAGSLKATYEKAAGIVAEPATWIENTSRFWYRRAVSGGSEYLSLIHI